MKIIDILNRRATLSFEIFPPKKQNGDISSIYQTVERLARLQPDFISVTYGAMGTSSDNTVEIASKIKHDYQIESVAHLTCVGADETKIKKNLDALKAAGIENVLALRGDYPADYNPQDSLQHFTYASDLSAYIKANYGEQFCVSGACYPEVHYEADNLDADLKALKAKVDAGCDYLVTQVFFDNDYYYRLIREARKRGINVPIIAGIMPAVNPKSLKNIAKVSGCTIPYRLSAMIERFAHNPQAMREVGMQYAAFQILDLITNGVDGIHIYTMNKPDIAEEILSKMQYIKDEFKDN